jgi:hypothetical protein
MNAEFVLLTAGELRALTQLAGFVAKQLLSRPAKGGDRMNCCAVAVGGAG